MKKVSFSIFILVVCLLLINNQPQFAATVSKNKTSAKKVSKQTAVWRQVSGDSLNPENLNPLAPEKYLVFRLSKTALTKILAGAPSELEKALPEKSVIMELPMPDGSFARFRIEESSVLEPALAARFPEIKSYRGQGIDDATLTTRFDWTPQGFHALILAGGETVSVEPANVDDASLYISYYGDDQKKGEYECLVKDFQNLAPGLPSMDAPQIAVGPTLRNYRIAIAANYEYTQAYGGGTVAATISSLNTWLNGANVIYERDLAIHLNLVNNTSIIYTTPDDPYNNGSVIDMLNAVIPDLNSKVGSANFDLGHVMGYLGNGASGVAYVGVACNTGYKGGGATLMGGSVGNTSTLGVWVHELGHEFGASHNFNGTLGNCSGGNRDNAYTYETGSGSTIMGYSGICGADNILFSRDMRFHAMSYFAINDYITRYGGCSINAATSNSAPTVNGGGNRNIPKNTPFTLTATASDSNGDSLTYNWEQIDAGGSAYPQNGTEASYNDAGDPSTTTRPIFRPYQSVTSPSRTFPNLFYVLNYANDPPLTDSYGQQTADELPRIGRTLNFRVTVRDNRSGGGGVNEDTVRVTVDGNSGPFLITSLNTSVSLTGGTAQTVTWSVNNTNVAPINAANVKISLSTDGGTTFPNVLAASTANDGSESVILPNITTTTARIKVEAVGNVFFDINNTNFSITAGTGGGGQGLEGDVASRPNGDGSIQSNDVIQVIRLLNELDTSNTSTNEFQRADSAPRLSKGDGVIDASDVIQTIRYFNEIDALQTAGGPTAPIGGNSAIVADADTFGKINSKQVGKTSAPSVAPELRVESASGGAGNQVTLNIRVDALGTESQYGFAVLFDPAVLTFANFAAGDTGAATFSCNTTATAGRVRCNVGAFPNNRTGSNPVIGEINAGNNQLLIKVIFNIAANAAVNSTTAVTLASVSASDENAASITPAATGGTVTIMAPTAAGVLINGRLDNGKGRGVANAQITMTDSRGETLIARSNAFGYFRFADVPSGETYIFTVKSKQYRFAAQVVNVTEDLTDLILTAQPRP